MKRILTWMLTLLLVLALAACASGSGENAQQSKGDVDEILYQKGLELISLMAEKASSESYLNTVVSPTAEMRAVFDDLSGDYTTPSAVYRAVGSSDGIRLSGASQALNDELSAQMLNARGSQYNGRQGAVSLAAASVSSSGTAFVCPGLTAPTQLLYLFSEGTPALVTFIPRQEGAVSATAMFILSYDEDEESLVNSVLSSSAEKIR